MATKPDTETLEIVLEMERDYFRFFRALKAPCHHCKSEEVVYEEGNAEILWNENAVWIEGICSICGVQNEYAVAVRPRL